MFGDDVLMFAFCVSWFSSVMLFSSTSISLPLSSVSVSYSFSVFSFTVCEVLVYDGVGVGCDCSGDMSGRVGVLSGEEAGVECCGDEAEEAC